MAQTSGFEKTTFFITYDGMIKNFQLTLLEILRSDIMKDKYNDILKIDILQELNVDELEGICLASESENILATIGRRMDVNYGAMLLDLFNKFPDLFSESKLLPLGQSINILNRQSFMDKIYLYTPVYDERIYMDIGDTFGDSKVV